MAGHAAVGVERVAVVDGAEHRPVPPAGEVVGSVRHGVGRAGRQHRPLDVVAERAHRHQRPGRRGERGADEAQRLGDELGDGAVEGQSGDHGHDASELHEPEVGVVARLPRRVAQVEAVDEGVGGGRVAGGHGVERVPLPQPGAVGEQITHRDRRLGAVAELGQVAHGGIVERQLSRRHQGQHRRRRGDDLGDRRQVVQRVDGQRRGGRRRRVDAASPGDGVGVAVLRAHRHGEARRWRSAARRRHRPVDEPGDEVGERAVGGPLGAGRAFERPRQAELGRAELLLHPGRPVR